MAKKLASDKALFTVVVLLVAFGLVMVFSASAALARGHGGGLAANPFLIKQGLAAGIGVVAMLGAMHVDYRTWKRPVVVYAALLGVVALLAMVLLVGPSSTAPGAGSSSGRSRCSRRSSPSWRWSPSSPTTWRRRRTASTGRSCCCRSARRRRWSPA
jgi:hypothetical protein